MKEKNCGTCQYSLRDSYTYDLVCMLEDSPYYFNFIAWDNECKFYEVDKRWQKENKPKRNRNITD